MELLLVLLVLIAVAVGGFVMFQRAKESPLGKRTETYLRSEREQQPLGPSARELTVETLRPGDAVSFWDGEDATVECVLQCEEQVGSRRTRWRWTLLRGGRMLEVAPDGNVLYAPGEALFQGSAPFEQLTGDPAIGGVLKTFEARVRAGTVGSNPVFFEWQGHNFQVRSTGTFSATPLGPPPRGEVWRDLSEAAGDNVYFEMDTPEGTQALGVWTTHILLLVGEPLRQTDIRSMYPGQTDPASL